LVLVKLVKSDLQELEFSEISNHIPVVKYWFLDLLSYFQTCSINCMLFSPFLRKYEAYQELLLAFKAYISLRLVNTKWMQREYLWSRKQTTS